MRIHIKTKWFEIYSDTTKHQLLILCYLTTLWVQFYAWSMHIDHAVWAVTSTVILALVAYCTGIEYKLLRMGK